MNKLKKGQCKKDKLIFGEVLVYCFHDNFGELFVIFGDCFDFFFFQYISYLKYHSFCIVIIISIALTKNPFHHDRSKHIDQKYHYFHEKVEHGDTMVVYCSTKDRVVIVLTKTPPRPKHMKCLTLTRIIEFFN
jgi:hypothetical protein